MKPFTTFDVPFLSGESYRFFSSAFERLEQLPSNWAGLYSWHIRMKPGAENELPAIVDKLFMQSSLTAEVKGNLRLHYQGALAKVNQEVDSSVTEFFRTAFLAIAYPLYIGVSIDLKGRLSTHKKHLNDAVIGKHLNEQQQNIVIDTDAESRYFGARLGALFRAASSTRVDCLYVRFIVHPESVDESGSAIVFNRGKVQRELRDAERYANSLFNPVFGRR